MTISFADRAFAARTTARMLLEVGAVNFRAGEPYKFTSGLASPVYIDCRKLISFPRVRATLMDFAAARLLEVGGFASIDAVAGGETAGIPFAAWIAERLFLPMLYVRKQAKGFGRNAQVEGFFKDGDRVVLVEDLATDGGSKVKFAEALRTAGARVSDSFVLFYYDIFPEGLKTLDENGLKLHWLCTWWDVLDYVRQENYFDTETIGEVEKFLHHPLEWSLAHGGVGQTLTVS